MIVSTRRAEALTIDTRNINRLSFLKVRDGGRASQGYPGILAVLFVSSMRCRGVDGVKTFTLVFRIQRGGVQFGFIVVSNFQGLRGPDSDHHHTSKPPGTNSSIGISSFRHWKPSPDY
jgi:hypothetical protein